MLEWTAPIYGANTTVGLTSISTLLCPSESLPKTPSFTLSSSSPIGYAGQFAVSNYAGNYGGPAMLKACSGTIIPVTGNNLVFHVDGRRRRDGSRHRGPGSHPGDHRWRGQHRTLQRALAGRRQPLGRHRPQHHAGGINGKRGLFPDLGAGGPRSGKHGQRPGFRGRLQGPAATAQATTAAAFGSQWLLSLDFATANNAYSHVMPPNGISCTGTQTATSYISNPQWGGIGAAITATSNHPGGVNVGFCDGSVKFVKDSVDTPTWWALGTRNGHEIISTDAY